MKVKEPFLVGEGPCVQTLDRALGDIGIERQAYYGGTFVGNHVHKCCKVHNYTMVCEKFPIIPHLHVLSQDENIIHICQSIVNKTQVLCPPVTDDAVVICDCFITASRLFGRCHNIYSTADSMEDEIIQLGIIIDNKALLDELSI